VPVSVLSLNGRTDFVDCRGRSQPSSARIIVYREAPNKIGVAPPLHPERRKRWMPDDVLLFRYSALTTTSV
jgi:hydroxyacyl-ACP dehydratase HTD2-like protein with hotdog domain